MKLYQKYCKAAKFHLYILFGFKMPGQSNSWKFKLSPVGVGGVKFSKFEPENGATIMRYFDVL